MAKVLGTRARMLDLATTRIWFAMTRIIIQMPSAYKSPSASKMLYVAFTIALLWTTETAGVNAAACNATVLASIARDTNLLTCISTSGVSLASIAATPSAEQLEGLCHSDSCIAFVSDLKALDLKACTAFDGRLIDLASNFVEPVLSACTTMGVVINNANVDNADGSTAVGMKISSENSASTSGSNLRGSSVGSASENKDAATVDDNDHPNTGIAVAVSEVPTPTPATPTSSASSSFFGSTLHLVAIVVLLGSLA